MKRFGSVLLMGVMVMSLAGCGGQSTKATTAAESVATAEAETESKADASEEAGKADAESGDSDAEKESGEKGTFTVGFDQDFPPMGFVGDDGEYTGFDLELAKEVADRKCTICGILDSQL